jgi:hypothetical protein
VANTIENAANETHGWYAENQGCLKLKALSISTGNPTCNWGEAPYSSDTAIDLVNSVQTALTAVSTAGTLSYDFWASDRSDMPSMNSSLAIGVWKGVTSNLAFDSGDGNRGAVLTFRYDDQKKAALSASDLRNRNLLIVRCNYDSQNQVWVKADEIRTSLDETNKLTTSRKLTEVTDLNSLFIVVYPIMGDANLDGYVDVGDLGILAANYGMTSGATWLVGDFNGDGAVNVGDLGILTANYDSTGDSIIGDFNDDQVLDENDLELWMKSFDFE